MDETTISDTVEAVTEGVKNGAAAIASEAQRQFRETGPRLARSYDNANDDVGGVVANRQLPAMLAVGAVGVLIGWALARR